MHNIIILRAVDFGHALCLLQKYFTTVTLWGTCGRYSGRSYHEWDGVVCLGQQDLQNKDGKVRADNRYVLCFV